MRKVIAVLFALLAISALAIEGVRLASAEPSSESVRLACPCV